MNFAAKKLDTAAAIIPATVGSKNISPAPSVMMSYPCNTADPKMTGIDIRKEKDAAGDGALIVLHGLLL